MNNNVKRVYIFFGLFLLFSLIHNLIFGFFRIEEAVFFLLGLLWGVLFIGSMVYTIYTCFKHKDMASLWSLGWLGLVGLVGFIPQFGSVFFGLYGFFGFFGFFGLKQ